MKLTVKCSVAGGDSSTKELVIHNPAATLSNLRAAIAINFRLPVYSFRMVHGTADLSCEKTLLRDSGIRDGDMIVVSAKREREEDENDESDVVRNNKEKGENKNNKEDRGDDGAGESQKDEQTAEGKETGAKAPAPLTTTTTTATAMPSPTPAVSGGGDVFARADSSGHDNEDDNNSNNNNEDDDDDFDDDGMDDDDGPTELLSHLLATVPNLVEMRQQFLASPAEVMQQIRDRDPRLLELITANHQEFLDIVSNESLVQTLQEEQEAFADEEVEFDEEAEEAMTAVLAQMMAGGEAAEEAAETETENYLRRATTEEEEAKIEQLTQLGFNRDQCKVAFFKAKRSLERAANLLFEDPPQL